MESVATAHLSVAEIGMTVLARSQPLSSKQIPPWLEAFWPRSTVLASLSQGSQLQAAGSKAEIESLDAGALSCRTDGYQLVCTLGKSFDILCWRLDHKCPSKGTVGESLASS